MLEQAKRPDSSPKSANGSGDSESLLRRPMDREVDPFGPKLEAPPTGPQSFSEDKAPTGAEAQAHEIGDAIAADLPRGLNLSHGALPSSVSEVAERHVGVSLGAPQMSLGGDGQRMAKQQGALAVAEGDTISVAAGELSTGTEYGRAVLGHELTHIAQQHVHGRTARQGLDGSGGAPPRHEGEIEGAEGAGGKSGGTSGVIELGSLTRPETLDAIRDMVGPEKILKARTVREKREATEAGDVSPKGTKATTKTGSPSPPSSSGPRTYGFGVAQAWASFGATTSEVARENPDLWVASEGFEGMTELPAVEALFPKISGDVLNLVEGSLDKSEALAHLELAELGEASDNAKKPTARDDAESESDTVSTRVAEIRRAALVLRLLCDTEANLRTVPVYVSKPAAPGASTDITTPFDPAEGYPDYVSQATETKTAEDSALRVEKKAEADEKKELEPQEGGTNDSTDLGSEPPPLPLPYVVVDEEPPGEAGAMSVPKPNASTEEPSSPWDLDEPEFGAPDLVRGGAFNWSTVFRVWDQVQTAKDAIGTLVPAAFALSSHGKLNEFLGAKTDEEAASVAAQAIQKTLEAIYWTRGAIQSQALAWYDFDFAIALLVAGVPGTSGTTWSDPVPHFAIEAAEGKSRENFTDTAVDFPLNEFDFTPEKDLAKARDELDSKAGRLTTAKRAAMSPLLQTTTRGPEDLQRAFDEALKAWAMERLVPLGPLHEPAKHLIDRSPNNGQIEPLRRLARGMKRRAESKSASRFKTKIKKTRGNLTARIARMKRLGGRHLVRYLKTFPEDLRGSLRTALNRKGWVGHHLIPVEAANRELLRIAAKLKPPWDYHSLSNSIPLPSLYTSKKLGKHASKAGHRLYNQRMEAFVEKETSILKARAQKEGKSLAEWAQTRAGREGVRASIRKLEQQGIDQVRWFAEHKISL